MNIKHLILTLLTLAAPCVAGAASPKLGWAGGDAADHNASNAAWYYRWWHTIPDEAAGSLSEFIPLIKYPNNIQAKVNSVAGLPNVDTLLVLNEPERPEQSDTTVQEALSIWPTIQAGLPGHKLVSPAVSDNTAGQNWLTSFMDTVDARNANADPQDDLRVDAVAFHWYGASSPNPISAANSFLSRVDWYHTRFNRPVWITEFAMHDWEGNDPTSAMIQANADFLEIVLPELESRSYVERYSYYNWFDDAMVFEAPDRMPTAIGDQYVGALLPSDFRDLSGQGLGTDIVYLRGGGLTNTGPVVSDAMRSIDVLGGTSVISAETDWSMAGRRDSYLRVRPGAVLNKIGSASIEVPASVTNDGTLRVLEGQLLLRNGSHSGGVLIVEEGATLATSFQDGRGAYSFDNTRMEVAGSVEGAVRLLNGTVLTPLGRSATFAADLTALDTIIDVGGPGFSVTDNQVFPIQAGLRLNYDAALDPPGDNDWSNTTAGTDEFTFTSPATAASVVDPGFPGIGAAYAISQTGGATGLNQFFEGGAPRSRQDATFEVVFRVQDLAAGSDQVLLEVGGAARGVAFVVNDSLLTFNVDGDAGDVEVTSNLGTGWHHAVGVVELDSTGDTVSLWVDGQLAGTIGGQNINDWAGGNVAGLGAGANSVTGVASGVGAAYHGDIAVARYYEDAAFDVADVQHNYTALVTPLEYLPTELIVEGDLNLRSDTHLLLDIDATGKTDRVLVTGQASLGASLLEVSLTGDGQLSAGDSFDLFDFGSVVGDFGGLMLPGLDPSLRWRADRLISDGGVEVVLTGDLNADGRVDAADYTVWRDSSGEAVAPFTHGDSNGDGLVNTVDYLEWRGNFGATSGALVVAVPSPAARSLIALLGAVLVCRRLK